MQVLREILLAPLLVAPLLVLAGCGPSTAPEYLEAAEKLRSRGNLAKATLFAQQAAQLEPQNPGAYKILGDLLLSTSKPEVALLTYEKARKYGENSPELYEAELNAKLAAGRSREVIREILDLDEKTPELEFILAEAYERRDDLDRARELFQASENPHRFQKLGWLESDSGRYGPALDAFNSADTGSFDLGSYREFARMQRFFEAEASIPLFQRLATVPHLEYGALRDLVRTSWIAGDDQQAAAYLNELTEKHYNRSGTNFLIGIQELRRGNHVVASRYLRTLYYHRRREYLLLPVAMLEYELGNLYAASQFAERLLWLEPNNASAAKLVVAINVQSGEKRIITRQIKRFAQYSHDPQLLRMIGEFALREGDVDFALQIFARIRRSLGNSENSRLTMFLNIGASPVRARLFMPVTIESPNGLYADNCFGFFGAQDGARIDELEDICGKDVVEFLLALRALNASDGMKAAEHLRKAAEINSALVQPKLLLAQLEDPRFSSAGFRIAGSLPDEPHRFGTKDLRPDLGPEEWQALAALYSELAGQGIYDALLIDAEAKLAAGETEAAIDLLARLTRRDSDRFEAFEVLANVETEIDVLDKWLRNIRNSTNRYLWNSWEMRMVRVRLFELVNDLENASQTARYLQDPIDLYPSIPAENRMQLAELQYRLGEMRLATENYQHIVDDKMAAAELQTIASLRLSQIP